MPQARRRKHQPNETFVSFRATSLAGLYIIQGNNRGFEFALDARCLPVMIGLCQVIASKQAVLKTLLILTQSSGMGNMSIAVYSTKFNIYSVQTVMYSKSNTPLRPSSEVQCN